MNFDRRNFLKGVSLATFAGAAMPHRLAAEGTTLVSPGMANGLQTPGKLAEVAHDVDVCVVGGGMGGLLTAISAARRGAKVALMHDRPVLGGNASSEIRMWICGAGTRVRNLQETGVMEEIALDNMHRNPSRNWSIWDTLLYEKVRFEPNIDLILNCACCEAKMDGARIASVTGFQLTTCTLLVALFFPLPPEVNYSLIPYMLSQYKPYRPLSSSYYGENLISVLHSR